MLHSISLKFAMSLFFLLLFSSVIFGQQQENYLKTAAGALVDEIIKDTDVQNIKGQVVVIAEFENINVQVDVIPRMLQEYMITALIKSKHLKVVERVQLVKALEEMKLTQTALADPKWRKEIGKYVGATYILVGSISEIQTQFSINARLVAIENGENITAAEISVPSPSAIAANSQPPPLPDKNPDDQNIPAANTNGQIVGTLLNPQDILRGNRFRMAWTERIPGEVYAFNAGPVGEKGAQRCIFLSIVNDVTKLAVLKWEANKFRQIWLTTDNIYYAANVMVLPIMNKPYAFIVNREEGAYANNGAYYQWNGLLYQYSQTYKSFVASIQDGSNLLYNELGWSCLKIINLANASNYDEVYAAIKKSQNVTIDNAIGNAIGTAMTLGDLNGDDKLEIACIMKKDYDVNSGGQISIYSQQGIYMAKTEQKYDTKLTVWNNSTEKYPYLVARKNELIPSKEDGKFTQNGGYVYLLQWNGGKLCRNLEKPEIRRICSRYSSL